MNTGNGFAAFDAACAEFEQSFSGGGTDFSVGPGGMDLDQLNEVLGELKGLAPHNLSSNAAARARQLLDMYHVMKAARGLVNDAQAARYASAIHQLHIEYDLAASAAMLSHNYAFSQQLRNAAGTLMDAYHRVQANIAAMNSVATAMNGAATLIGALA